MQFSPADHPAQVRDFRDSEHRQWRVFERQKEGPGDRPVTVLVFASADAFRIVRTYPPDWHELEPEALEYLSWRV